MVKEKRYDLTEGNIRSKLLYFFLPIAAGTIFQQLYNAVDAAIVGKFVGTTAFAAVGGSASQLTNVIVSCLVALTSGGAVIISQLFGAEDRDYLSKASNTAITFSAALGLLVTVLGVIFTPAMLKMMHTPEDTFDESVIYMKIYFSGVIFMLLFNMGSGILRATGDSARPFRFLMFSCVLNIVLDLLFVIVFKLGVAGVAIATVISQIISSMLVIVFLFKSKESYALVLKKLGINFYLLGRMIKIGVPTALQSLMYGGANIYIQSCCNIISTVAVAAWALSGKLDGFYWATINAAGTAVMNFVGQNYGAGKFDRIKESIKVSMKLFIGITISFSIIIISIRNYAFHLFIDDPEVIETTIKVVMYLVPFYVVWTVIELLSGVLRGVGNALPPTIITGFGIALFRVIWMSTLFKARPTILMMSMSFPASWVLTAAAMIIYFKLGNWQHRSIGDESRSKK